MTRGAAWHQVFEERRRLLERSVAAYLPTRRWFGGKARTVAGARIIERLTLPGSSCLLALVSVRYEDGGRETYLLPLACAFGEGAAEIERAAPEAIVARSRSEVLYDAVYDPSFGPRLVEHLLALPPNDGLRRFVQDLNRLYREEPVLHQGDVDPDGFEWIDCADSENSVVAFVRRAKSSDELVLVACNFTPVPRHNYRLGAPRGGVWKEVLNSDAKTYGGSGQGNLGALDAAPVGAHGRYDSLNLVLPPLGVVFLKSEAASS